MNLVICSYRPSRGSSEHGFAGSNGTGRGPFRFCGATLFPQRWFTASPLLQTLELQIAKRVFISISYLALSPQSHKGSCNMEPGA